MISWLSNNYVEIIGTICGLFYIWLSVKQNIALWSVGILSSALYIVVFYKNQLYADMSLNLYYLLVSVYGWIHWKKKKNTETKQTLQISELNLWNWIEYLGLSIVLTLALYWILKNVPQKLGFSPSSIPFWDALVTAGSITATWMLARKVLEQWLWWIVIDAISIAMFIYKELYFTSFLFLVYTIMAVWGYFEWRNERKRI
jgi:nicotinamide mononucleotide transporter